MKKVREDCPILTFNDYSKIILVKFQDTIQAIKNGFNLERIYDLLFLGRLQKVILSLENYAYLHNLPKVSHE